MNNYKYYRLPLEGNQKQLEQLNHAKNIEILVDKNRLRKHYYFEKVFLCSVVWLKSDNDTTFQVFVGCDELPSIGDEFSLTLREDCPPETVSPFDIIKKEEDKVLGKLIKETGNFTDRDGKLIAITEVDKFLKLGEFLLGCDDFPMDIIITQDSSVIKELLQIR